MFNHADIFKTMRALPEASGATLADLEPHFAARKPFVVRDMVKDWPLVKAGKTSARAARDYLLSKAVDRPFPVSMGSDEFNGRLFYRDDMSMNIEMGKAKLPLIFDRIDAVENTVPAPIIYLSAINVTRFFDGLHEENHVDFGDRVPMESIWIGTKSRIAAHNDFPDNLACVAVGRRRFTLFPPDQIKNLYIGPVDNTPAGRAISMVDFHNPDFEAYPKFKDALDNAFTAELEPGDALHIPSMWWHHVEGLDPFNVLVNYWWRDTPRYFGGPQNALNHAMMAIRDLPDDEKSHWRDVFNHYVFDNTGEVTDHIPEHGHGILGPMTAKNASKIRSFLIKTLSSE
ncbi:cupin-like domain-containing protein [Fretibacter rubidus]|uniref:cupin-like domain-containing protein n=1 Tax=Fretibacter rubidus TaxID=570162 RepID=UPI00352A6614